MERGPGDLPELDAELGARAGEDILSRSPEQADRWVRFYEDLAAFELKILENMEDLAGRLPADRREAVAESNVEPMRRLIASLERRAGLWRMRRAELRGEDPPL